MKNNLKELIWKGGLHSDAAALISQALSDSAPQKAVSRALEEIASDPRPVTLVAIGKAAWTMAEAASSDLGKRVKQGIVITKYGHSKGDLPSLEIFEAGHPVVDEASLRATARALEMVDPLTGDDLVVFLVSGGGSALFEDPLIPLHELREINERLLASGADIVSMNRIRKRLSRVKGGRFAERCAPAAVFSVILSDVLGDPLDSIASGPAAPDRSTSEETLADAARYLPGAKPEWLKLLAVETPKELPDVQTVISGSVRGLCESARKKAEQLGYECLCLTDRLNCEAREAGRFLASVVLSLKARNPVRRTAVILGGETTVTLRGNGRGGRNQEMMLAAAREIAGQEGLLLFSLGSDGSDGPTDAAGGIVTGESWGAIRAAGGHPQELLDNNDSYAALQLSDGLLITGPTGTNVNDLTVALIG